MAGHSIRITKKLSYGLLLPAFLVSSPNLLQPPCSDIAYFNNISKKIISILQHQMGKRHKWLQLTITMPPFLSGMDRRHGGTSFKTSLGLTFFEIAIALKNSKRKLVISNLQGMEFWLNWPFLAKKILKTCCILVKPNLWPYGPLS